MNLGLTQGLAAQPIPKRDGKFGLGFAKWTTAGVKPLYAIQIPWGGSASNAFQLRDSTGAFFFNVASTGGVTTLGFVTANTFTSTGNNVTSNGFVGQSANNTMVFTGTQKSGASTSNDFQFTQTTSTKSGGQTNYFSLLPTYSAQTGATANTDFLINRTETAIGSGTQLLIDAQVGSTSKFNVSNTGVVTTQAPTILKGYTVATLPSTAATGQVQGAIAFVTNALAPTFGTAVVGGGAVVIPVFYDGTNWVSY